MEGRKQRTFIMVKPDGVQRRLVGEVIKRFEAKGFKLTALKLLNAPESLLRNHYAEHDGKPFFPKLLAYVGSGPVAAMVWEGTGVIAAARKLVGATKPLESEPGTIRGDFAIDVGRNIIHGSDGPEAAEREIALWFNEGVVEWNDHSTEWLYE